MNILPKLPKDFPKIVCLCGSTRFSDAFKEANLRETIAGNIVLSIGCDTKSDKDLMILGELTEEAKEKLDELHKRKIDLADEILVLNVGGYIGDSTRSEIDYALTTCKEIRYLEEPNKHFLPSTVFHFAVVADSYNEYQKFIENTKIKNPVYVAKSGETMHEIGLNLIGFIVLGDHTIPDDVYNKIIRRIASRCLFRKS